MNFIDKCVEYVCKNEGFVPNVYLDTKNIPTLGFGRSLKTYPLTDKEIKEYCYLNPNNELCIFEDKAKIWVKDRIIEIDKQLDKQFKWYRELALDSMNRQVVLVDLVYNMGMSTVLKYKKFLSYMQEHDFVKASEELLTGSGKDGMSKYLEQTKTRALNNAHIIKFNKLDIK